MAQQRHLWKSPSFFAFADPHENEDSCVSWPDAQKSLSVNCENGNRKSTILDLVVNLAILTLNNLSQGFHQINFKLRWVSSQQGEDINYLKFWVFVTRNDRGVASKFDYTPSKHEVLYLRHISSNRVQTRHVRQESRPDDIYTEIMTLNQRPPWWSESHCRKAAVFKICKWFPEELMIMLTDPLWSRLNRFLIRSSTRFGWSLV